MLIYTDVTNSDEMISDAFDLKLVDDIAYEVDCKMVVIQEGDVDIGGNPSAEEEAEALENGGTSVNNVVHSFRLQKTDFDKKAYLTYLKGYMKSLKTYLTKNSPDQVEAFEKGAQAFAKKIVANFKDFDFYIGESMDPEGMVVLMNYREDGVTPYMIYWKHGLKEMKV